MAKFTVTAEAGLDIPAVAAVEAVPAIEAVAAQDAYHANKGDVVDLSDAQVAALDATLLTPVVDGA